MRVLQINVVYAQGSTGHITETLHKEYLKEGIDSYVLFGRGPKQDDKRVTRCSYLWEAKLWRFISLFTGNIYGGVPFSTLHIKHLVKKMRPDIVHLQCINGNMVNIYSLMNWLKKKKIKTVLTHHAEFMYTGGCGVALCPKWKDHCEHCPHKKEVFGRFSIDRSASNWKRFRSSYQSFNLLANVFVSPWLQSQGMQSPLLKGFGQTDIILNPINVEIFNPAADAPLPKALACKKYVLMPVARFFDPNKKTSSIEEVANGIQKEGLFLAIAGAPKDFQFINPNIVNLGFVSSSFEMASLYRHAQCTLVLSQRESFSMPVAESLCCGTPVAGFKAGGPESLPFSKSACFVNQGDYSSLTAAVKKLSNDRAISPLALLSPESISRQYQEVYLDVLNDNKQNEVK